jgi:hypothetical protein
MSFAGLDTEQQYPENAATQGLPRHPVLFITTPQGRLIAARTCLQDCKILWTMIQGASWKRLQAHYLLARRRLWSPFYVATGEVTGRFAKGLSRRDSFGRLSEHSQSLPSKPPIILKRKLVRIFEMAVFVRRPDMGQNFSVLNLIGALRSS